MSPDRAQFLIFVATGGIAAGVNVLARFLFELAVPYEYAVGLAYPCGMVTAFILARVFVFKPRPGAASGQFLRFTLVNAVAFGQVWLVSIGLARLVFPATGFTWNAETLAHVIGVASPVVTSYLLHKHFSFRAA